MHQDDQDQNQFDQATARILTRFAQQTSRRGFLARIGRFLLTSLGVATVPLLPLDRITRKVEAANCSDWQLCGIYGKPCDCCQGGDLYYCPPGFELGSWWTSCCQDPETFVWYKFAYVDCCRIVGHVVNCSLCGSCYRNPVRQPAWCIGSPDKIVTYGCTYIEDWGPQAGPC